MSEVVSDVRIDVNNSGAHKLKRKASQDLTPNSVLILEPLLPTYQMPREAFLHNLQGKAYSFYIVLTQICAIIWNSVVYTTMRYGTKDILTEAHVQTSNPRADGTSIKRHKLSASADDNMYIVTENNDETDEEPEDDDIPDWMDPDDKYRKGGRGMVPDVRGLSDDEAERICNLFWECPKYLREPGAEFALAQFEKQKSLRKAARAAKREKTTNSGDFSTAPKESVSTDEPQILADSQESFQTTTIPGAWPEELFDLPHGLWQYEQCIRLPNLAISGSWPGDFVEKAETTFSLLSAQYQALGLGGPALTIIDQGLQNPGEVSSTNLISPPATSSLPSLADPQSIVKNIQFSPVETDSSPQLPSSSPFIMYSEEDVKFPRPNLKEILEPTSTRLSLEGFSESFGPSSVPIQERMQLHMNRNERPLGPFYSISKHVATRREKEAEKRREHQRLAAIDKAKELRLTRRYPKSPLIQPMALKWEMKVREIISQKYDTTRVVTTSAGGTELRIKDFNTLLGERSWLNDEIINTYLEWIVAVANQAAGEEATALGIQTSSVPKFITHNSFFYENLIKKGGISTNGLMRRKKAPGTSLLEVDTVFVPICKGNHWTLGAVRPVAKTIEYFDSMGGNSEPYVSLMRTWLEFQLKDSYIHHEWTVPYSVCVRQTNSFDCGVFLSTNAMCVAFGLDTNCYTQKDMGQQRKNIAGVLLNKGFRDDFQSANFF